MEAKNKSVFVSDRIIATVDFIKWTSTFGEDAIKQMETPVSGVRLTAALLHLFGMVRGEHFPMLAMHETEAPWLAHLPIQMALAGYGDGIILVTESHTVFDQPFPSIGIDIFVPHEYRNDFTRTRMMGLCHVNHSGPSPVNKTFPVYTRERYERERRTLPRGAVETSLFSGI
ncbi:hypothetical protein [Burkholderia ubonensis]|uniref:hypothetical protein n=1 Tax=Burkholderia ubonensis TaxID=101571 RepID=UPI00075E9C95|nr:hypothetical protein [Burkholderia ubonensis]KVV07306.1 hypothetical protein WK77_16065 [Burkholderia ubonensis]